MLKLLREILFNSNMQKVCKSKIDKRLQILGSCRDTWSFYYAKNEEVGFQWQIERQSLQRLRSWMVLEYK